MPGRVEARPSSSARSTAITATSRATRRPTAPTTRENLREEKDCLKLFADRVVSAGLVDKEELEKIDEQVRTLIDEAVEEAKAAPDPKENDLLTDVYVSY